MLAFHDPEQGCFTDDREDKVGCLSAHLAAVYAFCDKRRKGLALLLAFTLTQFGKDTVIPKAQYGLAAHSPPCCATSLSCAWQAGHTRSIVLGPHAERGVRTISEALDDALQAVGEPRVAP